MLNPDLYLNPNIFSKELTLKSTREGFGTGVVTLGEVEKNIVVLTADLSESTKALDFQKKFPERFFQCGVAEQNMAAISAGLAASGKIPFMTSYSVFSPGKNWETIRTTIIYNDANVKIAGNHTGLATGPDGVTHQATEDIAIVRSWPNIQIIVPCDAIEAHKATIAAAYISKPVYLRFSRENTPVITTDTTPYDPNKTDMYWISDQPQVVIMATGYMVYYALLAAKELESEGIQTLVANVSNIKPLDKKAILEMSTKAGAVVTVEDHQIVGGLGSTIAELFAKEMPLPMEFIGLQNTFAESGKPDELRAKYNMDVAAIKKAVTTVIKRKNPR